MMVCLFMRFVRVFVNSQSMICRITKENYFHMYMNLEIKNLIESENFIGNS